MVFGLIFVARLVRCWKHRQGCLEPYVPPVIVSYITISRYSTTENRRMFGSCSHLGNAGRGRTRATGSYARSLAASNSGNGAVIEFERITKMLRRAWLPRPPQTREERRRR